MIPPKHLLLVLLVLNFSCLSKHREEKIDDQFESSTSAVDSILIKHLFDLGNRFVSGPSDSLLYYYDSARKIINHRILDLEYQGIGYNNSDYRIYKQFEIRADIEFGIEHFYLNNYDKALSYYFEALEISRNLMDEELVSECLSEIGIVYKNQGNYDLALKYYDEAYEKAKLTSDSSWIASCQVNIGNVYKEKGYLTIALKRYIDALSILGKLNHSKRIAACFQNIGDIYHTQKDYKEALYYFEKAQILANESNDKMREIALFLNIGSVRLNLNQNMNARASFEKALALYRETGYQHEKDNCFMMIGDSYINENRLNQAIQYYQRALVLSEANKDRSAIAEIKRKLGTVYMKQGFHSKALNFFLQSDSIAKKLNNLELMLDASGSLSNYYEHRGQTSNALSHFKRYSTLKDSLFNAEKYKTIREVEAKFELEKKEQQYALLTEKSEVQQLKLSRRKRLLVALAAGFIMLILIAYLLYFQSRLKSQQRSIELEQRLLRTQMNPHFVFNSLIAIQSYIYKKDPVTAGDYLAKFAELVRLTLENSRSEFVSLEREIKTLKNYLELQCLRFENEFDYELTIDESIYVEAYKIPPMFTQPFIENAIEHGLRHKKEKGLIKITYRLLHDCCIEIEVKDDGIGREKAKNFEHKKEHQSLAIEITRERLINFGKKFKRQYGLNVSDINDGRDESCGTIVTITLPILKN